MILYQRITVSTQTPVGAPGPLPPNLLGFERTAAGLAALANLPAALSAPTIAQLGLQDTGYLPVDVTPDPGPPPVPPLISRMQLRRQMLRMDRTDSETSLGKLLDQFDAAIAGFATTGTLDALDLREYWANTSEFHRDHPVMIAFAASQGVTGAMLDTAFISGALLS